MTESNSKKIERVREGVVVSDKMDKTRIVAITRVVKHPVYKKIMKRQIRYAVHDQDNVSKAGDKVQIVQSRPVSKNKRWKLKKVVAS